MTEEQIDLLTRFVGLFGYTDRTGYVAFYVLGKGVSRRDFPEDTRLYSEASVEFAYRLKEAGLVEITDYRQGTEFDGPYGCNPGWAPGKPTDHVGVVVINDEALAWLNARRPK